MLAKALALSVVQSLPGELLGLLDRIGQRHAVSQVACDSGSERTPGTVVQVFEPRPSVQVTGLVLGVKAIDDLFRLGVSAS